MDGDGWSNGVQCCMSNKDSASDWKDGENKHWIIKDNIGTMNSKDGGYLTMTINILENVVSVYWNGEFVDSTICNHEWMLEGGLTDNSIPFTIGFQVGASPTYEEVYSKVDIYACRLYNRVLTADEVKSNYEQTVDYHNMLANQE